MNSSLLLLLLYLLLPAAEAGFIRSPALFGMGVQNQKFSSTFSSDFDEINSIAFSIFSSGFHATFGEYFEQRTHVV